MRRVSHDLPGISQRIGRLAQQLDLCAQETREIWKDAKYNEFHQRYLADSTPAIRQLLASLTETHERFEQVTKQLSDPDSD